MATETRPLDDLQRLKRRSQRNRLLMGLANYGTLGGLAIMLIVFSVGAPATFPTISNLVNVVTQITLTAIIAGGCTLVLVVGEFDLSIGYAASFAGVVVTGLMVNQGLPLPLAVLAAIALGAGIGLTNGLIITQGRVNSVIATLGVGTILIGLNYWYSAGLPIAAGLPKAFMDIALGNMWGIPNTIIVMTVVLVSLWALLNVTDLGRRMQAVGGNAEAARLSGIRMDRVKVIAFVICGSAAALTGVLLSSLIGSGQYAAGDSYMLDAFTAVFLGSATLRDGEFHIVGTFIGALIVGVAFNGLAIFGTPVYFQYVAKGGILIAAMALSTIARRYAQA